MQARFSATAVVLSCFFSAASASAQQAIRVETPSSLPRTEFACASIPFSRGQQFEPLELSIDGRPTSWRVLQRWADGSVRVAQAQYPEVLAARETLARSVQSGAVPCPSFALHPAVAESGQGFVIQTRVTDRYGVVYEAAVTPLVSPQATVLEDTPMRKTVRTRAYHRNGAGRGIGRDFLSQTCYVTFYHGMPYATVDVVIANDYLGADQPGSADPNLYPLGDVGFSKVDVTLGATEARVAHANWNRVGPIAVTDRGTSMRLLGESYLADGQGKRWRFIAQFGDLQNVGSQGIMGRTCAAMAEGGLLSTADDGSWRKSRAFGAVGGPVAPPHDAAARVVADHADWSSSEWFGPMGSWGDTAASFSGGSPRNGPMTDMGAHTVQTGSCLPFQQLEAMAFQQTLRAAHLWGLHITPGDGIMVWNGLPHSLTTTTRYSTETLGRLALQQNDPYARYREDVPVGFAHGWDGFSAEHFSIDALYDYWTLTGDHRTYDEIVNFAEGAMAASRLDHPTSAEILPARAEGWIAQGLVKAWLVTGDHRYRDHIVNRIQNVVYPQRPNHPSRAIKFQSSYPGTRFPMPHEFYLAWQHAAVVYGYLAVWQHFGCVEAREIAHDVVNVVEHSWVRNYQDPQFGLVANGLRYVTPVSYMGQPVAPDQWDSTPGIGAHFGEGPLFGSARFLVSALDLIVDDSDDRPLRARARWLRLNLMTPAGPLDDQWRWMRWCFLRETPLQRRR